MSINSELRTAGPIAGSGTDANYGPFTFSFKILSANHLYVQKRKESDDSVEVLVKDTDYTVNLNVNQDVSPGGTIS